MDTYGEVLHGRYGVFKTFIYGGVSARNSEKFWAHIEAGQVHDCNQILVLGNSNRTEYIWSAFDGPRVTEGFLTRYHDVVYMEECLENLSDTNIEKLIAFPFMDEHECGSYLKQETDFEFGRKKKMQEGKIPRWKEINISKDLLAKLACYCVEKIRLKKTQFLYILVPSLEPDYFSYCRSAMRQILLSVPCGMRKNFSFSMNPKPADEQYYGIIFRRDGVEKLDCSVRLNGDFDARFLDETFLAGPVREYAENRNGKFAQMCINSERNAVLRDVFEKRHMDDFYEYVAGALTSAQPLYCWDFQNISLCLRKKWNQECLKKIVHKIDSRISEFKNIGKTLEVGKVFESVHSMDDFLCVLKPYEQLLIYLIKNHNVTFTDELSKKILYDLLEHEGEKIYRYLEQPESGLIELLSPKVVEEYQAWARKEYESIQQEEMNQLLIGLKGASGGNLDDSYRRLLEIDQMANNTEICRLIEISLIYSLLNVLHKKFSFIELEKALKYVNRFRMRDVKELFYQKCMEFVNRFDIFEVVQDYDDFFQTENMEFCIYFENNASERLLECIKQRCDCRLMKKVLDCVNRFKDSNIKNQFYQKCSLNLLQKFENDEFHIYEGNKDELYRIFKKNACEADGCMRLEQWYKKYGGKNRYRVLKAAVCLVVVCVFVTAVGFGSYYFGKNRSNEELQIASEEAKELKKELEITSEEIEKLKKELEIASEKDEVLKIELAKAKSELSGQKDEENNDTSNGKKNENREDAGDGNGKKTDIQKLSKKVILKIKDADAQWMNKKKYAEVFLKFDKIGTDNLVKALEDARKDPELYKDICEAYVNNQPLQGVREYLSLCVFRNILNKRQKGEDTAYILSNVEFYDAFNISGIDVPELEDHPIFMKLSFKFNESHKDEFYYYKGKDFIKLDDLEDNMYFNSGIIQVTSTSNILQAFEEIQNVSKTEEEKKR